jgi:hypothetical protein
MKRRILGLLLAFGVMGTLTGCWQDVPAGSVGVKIYKLGGSKGVDHEVLGVGRYWIGWNEDLALFPTFQQQYTWTESSNEGKAVDESFTFQTAEGVSINTDVGIAHQIDPEHVGDLFQKFRQDPEQITDGFPRNIVRDDLNKLGAHDPLAGILGTGKQKLFDTLQAVVASDVSKIGPIGLRLFTVFGEPTVVLVEAVLIALLSGTTPRRALAISFLANLVSFFAGVLFPA